jgi:hypothetical protein
MVRSAVGLSSWCGVSPLVKWACGPFVDEGDGRAKRRAFLFYEPSVGHKGDRWMTCAHGLGGPCYWGARTASEDRVTGVRARPRRTVLRLEKKPGDAPRAALRSALGYLIMPLWGGGNEKPGDSPFPPRYRICPGDFV